MISKMNDRKLCGKKNKGRNSLRINEEKYRHDKIKQGHETAILKGKEEGEEKSGEK